MFRRVATALLLTASVTNLAHAQFSPGSFGGNGGNGGSGGSGGSGFGFDVDSALRIRAVHGVLAAVAFAILFPVGSILMRVIPGRWALWTHGLIQIAAYSLYIPAAGMGLWLVQAVQIPFQNGNLLQNTNINYHFIIGIVVLVCLFFQPLLGIVHHLKWKRLQRRQIWSYLHLFNGRIMIILGIVNGGLGLKIAGAETRLKVAYAIVAGVLGGLWLLVATFSEIKKMCTERKTLKPTPAELETNPAWREYSWKEGRKSLWRRPLPNSALHFTPPSACPQHNCQQHLAHSPSPSSAGIKNKYAPLTLPFAPVV